MHAVTASIARTYEIQAAHRLPNVPEGHKCGRLHGHTYAIEIEISGRVQPTTGWVFDFGMLDAVVKELIVTSLDHQHLNEIDGLENPTSELLAWWCWRRLSICGWPTGVALSRISVAENGHSRVTIGADLPEIERESSPSARHRRLPVI